ncbi:hypothetical protein ACU5CE_31890 [Priestia megaterium]|uniref:hypothetical protein n=1 Tax=Priestia megaterium TaxID=1404 RepID=UPI00406BB762
MPDSGLSDELKNELKFLGQPTDDSNRFDDFLSQLDIIPDQLFPFVKEEIDSCLKSGVESRIIDAFEYEEQGIMVYVILNLEDNHLKVIKRQMYGRAKLDLLSKKVLYQFQ